MEKWLKDRLDAERQAHLTFFGREFDLTKFQAALERCDPDTLGKWLWWGLEPHFFPEVEMSQDAGFSGWRVKLNSWFYQEAAKGNILRTQTDGRLITDSEPFKLEGIVVLIDSLLKPFFENGRQMFDRDYDLLGSIIERLRKEGKIVGYDEYGQGLMSSRFGVSSEEWEEHIKPALAYQLNLEVYRVRLERVIETNVIPQLYPHMPRQKDEKTDTFVWYEEYYGYSDLRRSETFPEGRLWGNSRYNFCDRWNNRSFHDRGFRAFRPLLVLDN